MSSPSAEIQQCIKNSGPLSQDSASCDCVYNYYGGRSPATAASIGVMNGFLGLFGAGGFWQATDDSSVTQATSDLNNLQAAWKKRATSENAIIEKLVQNFDDEVSQLSSIATKFNEEVLSEDIQKNTLLIQILAGLTLIIIIYLIIL